MFTRPLDRYFTYDHAYEIDRKNRFSKTTFVNVQITRIAFTFALISAGIYLKKIII